jgi:outer membrane protein OmpA-like peptidoglycan-associated protein
MATILDSLRNLVTPDLLARASSLLGETEGGVSRALGAAFPAILGAMMNKSGDAGTMRQVMDLLGDRGVDATVARNPLSLLAGGGLAKSPTTDLGGRFLSTLFGSQISGVSNALADHAGIKSSSASTLLGLAAPLVMAVLSDRVRSGGLSASGLASLLASQRDNIVRSIPAILGGLTGLGSIGGSTATDYAPRQVHRPKTWIPMTIAALLALAALWSFSRNPTRDQVATTSEPARLAAAVAKQDAVSFTRRLPNDFELKAPATGIERQIVVFVEDPSRQADAASWFNFDRLLFETGSARLKPESKDQLRNVAEIMKAYPSVKAKIGGYTDNVGDPAFNLKLSQDRAQAVVAELVADGVAPERLTAEGFGEQHPVADNSTEQGRQQNRRIALRVTEK